MTRRMVVVSSFLVRWNSVWLLCLAVLYSGCTPKPGVPPRLQSQAPAPPPADPTPSVVLLSDPKVTRVEADMVRFEVNYRFTQGKPVNWYTCTISFPGTANHAVKSMQGWELKAEGVLVDKVQLFKPGATTFVMHLEEAPTQRGPFHKISNEATGTIK